MKESTEHHNKDTIVEHFKEEGALTLETLEVASHDATTASHKKHVEKKFLTTPVAIIIASIIIACGLMGYGAITTSGNSGTKATMFTGKAIDVTTDYLEGKENSKIIVVEYSDPECPYCVQVSPTIKKLREEYGNKIAFAYRHFPLTQIHNHAFDESRAIACAGKVGGKEKFYQYIDVLYGYKMTNKTTQLSQTIRDGFAQNIGLDTNLFGSCMKENQTTEAVTNSINDGVQAGVQGTPSTFVLLKTRKGYEVISMVDGARPYDYFKTVVDEALSR